MTNGLPFLPDRASTVALHVDYLIGFLLAVTVILAGTIFVLILYFAIRYRRRRHSAVQIENNLSLEILWSVIPLGLTAVMFLWGAKLFMQNHQPPPNAESIYVVGKQWMWTIEHAEGRREIDQLHVPAGKPIRLILASQDVIHDFFIPAFRVKQDVVPGRYSTLWFEATKTGEFHLFCSQYCGTQHSAMIGKVIVMTPADFQVWLGGSRDESPAKAGAQLFQDFSCANCHEPGPRQRGPNLSGVFGKPVRLASGETAVFDEAYMHESIVAPGAKVVDGYRPIMPSFREQLTEDEIMDLIAYVRSLSSEGTKQ
jgi:cytochrome c oxidase subunit 2